MIRIKISTPWDHIDFRTRLSSALAGRYEFSFDDADDGEFDFWIVWGDIKTEKQRAVCKPENVIYITDEAIKERLFYRSYLNQFAAILTCRTDLQHRNIIHTHELNTWMIQRDYDWLYKNEEITKTKFLSVVASNQTLLPGHKLRFAFVNKLMGHFKDKIDVFGKGIRPVNDKFDALAPYKYSIAIENSVIPGYFTEKIADCYLTHTVPLYYGCPDIESYFDSNSLLPIDPNDFTGSVRMLEKLLQEDPYHNMLPLVKRQKMRYLEQYHIFNKLVQLLEKNFNVDGKKERITIRKEKCFHKGYYMNHMIGVGLKKLHMPGRFFFQIDFNQSGLYANIKND